MGSVSHLLRRRIKTRHFGLLLGGALTVGAPSTASAHPWVIVGPSSLPVVALSVPVTSGCFTFVYDHNGNRLSSSATNVSNAGVMWGTGTFGCSVWG